MFTIFVYKQPVEGTKLRCGVVNSERDTWRYPVGNRSYRQFDKDFRRSRNLLTVNTLSGPKCFYKERTSFRLSIPFVGPILQFCGLFK